jgi:ABC-2 type transport system permease protein
MSATLTAELRKLRATRTTTAAGLVVAGLSAAIAAANVLLSGKDDNPALDADTFQHVVRAPTAVVGFAMLVVGVLASAGEYRHRTIVPSLLAQPHRARLAVTKAQAVGIVGMVLATVSAVVSSAVGWVLLSSRDAPGTDLGPVPAALVVLGGTAALYGVLGVGLGLLLRNQAVAMTVALVWYFVVERVAPVVLRAPHAQKWLPGGAADAYTGLGDPAGGSAAGLVAPWLGGGLLTAYALALTALGTAMLVRRDQA